VKAFTGKYISEVRMICVLVTDLGNVILRYNGAAGLARIQAKSGVQNAAEIFSKLIAELGYGKGQTESKAFFRRVKEELCLQMGYEEFCTAWSDVFEEDWDVINLLLQTRVEKRYILSNTNDIHWTWIQQRHSKMLSLFDGAVVSHQCGAEKPDPAAYQQIVALSQRRPDEHLFIDDLPENVEGARQFGFDAILHTDLPALRAALSERNLI
jgi:HAD superfamily hydrolase (TIGR01509 family)